MSFSEAVAQRGLSSSYDGAIATAANAYGVDPALVKAIISQESNWNPQAYRAEPQIQDASYGLMQVLLATARATSGNPGLTSALLFDPGINIDIGTRYLATRLTRYGYPDGISAYNAGRPISGNQMSYVEPVIAYQAWYQMHDPLFGSAPDNPSMPPGSDSGGVADWLTTIFGGSSETPPEDPWIDPETGEVILPSPDILSGVGISVIVLGVGVLWLLTRGR